MNRGVLLGKGGRALLAMAYAALAARAVGPDYHSPITPSATLVNARSTEPAPLAAASPDGVWWQEFDDPVLNSLMSRALAANWDLKLALDRVREARAAFSATKFDYAPHVPATAGYTRSKEQQPGFGPQRYFIESYDVGFDATWELDLFGHVRRTVEAARGDLGAAREDLRDAQVTIAAEVARNYFSLRSTQEQIRVARSNLANQEETVRLTSVRYDSGRGAELDLQESRARLKATEAAIPSLEIARASYEYRLAVLLGERPGALDELLAAQSARVFAKTLPIGEQGDDAGELLRNRPDVRRAEQQLAAATARVGVATADLFPRVTITGFIGFLSGDFSHLFSSASNTDARAWSVSPTVSWSAFDLGTVRARLRGARAQADEALDTYQKTVLTALEDTENSFVNYREQQIRLKSLIEQAAASRRAADLAEIQYREGVADFITLLDAQRVQLAAESDVAQTQGAVNVAVVAIYKALGGIGQVRDRTMLATK